MIKRGRFLIFIFVIGSLIFSVVYHGHCGEKPAVQKEYWDDGRVRACKFFDDEGNLRAINYYREDGKLEQNEKYDMFGRKIEESYYGENGRLCEGADGWAALRNVHEGENLVMESYYDDAGHLKERKQYNELGDLVSKQYVGDDPTLPAEEFNPMPTLAGETVSYYDSYGRPEGESSVTVDRW